MLSALEYVLKVYLLQIIVVTAIKNKNYDYLKNVISILFCKNSQFYIFPVGFEWPFIKYRYVRQQYQAYHILYRAYYAGTFFETAVPIKCTRCCEWKILPLNKLYKKPIRMILPTREKIAQFKIWTVILLLLLCVSIHQNACWNDLYYDVIREYCDQRWFYLQKKITDIYVYYKTVQLL